MLLEYFPWAFIMIKNTVIILLVLGGIPALCFFGASKVRLQIIKTFLLMIMILWIIASFLVLVKWTGHENCVDKVSKYVYSGGKDGTTSIPKSEIKRLCPK